LETALSHLCFGQKGKRKMKTEITLYLNDDELSKLVEAKNLVAAIYNLFDLDEKMRKVADQAYDSLQYLIHNSQQEKCLNHNSQEEN
jgi:hypothetical protein